MDDLRTLSMIEARAHAILPPDLLAYAVGGSASEATLDRNRFALQHLAIEQHVLMGVESIDTRAHFLGLTLPSPIIVAPMGGMPRFNPGGDAEMARGATADGGMTVVAGGAPNLEEIGAGVAGPLIFQLYWLGDRDWVAERLSHVTDAYKAFCLTVDAAAYSRRERDIVLNVPVRRRAALPETQARLTWDDVDWVKNQLDKPFGLKGIMTAHDARLALDHGVDFIWVSNHGGRQIDDGRSTIDALIEIAEVVGGRVPIIIDSGFRRATDAMKALALGATLVAFGRVAAWGFITGGAEGVRKTLQLLHEELVINMKLSGQKATSNLSPRLIRRIDGSGFAMPVPRAAPSEDPEASLLSQLSPAQRAAVQRITEDSELSEVDKMWGITETLFGESSRGG